MVLESTGLKFHGSGEWARTKHREKRRSWRKIHVSVDPARCEIVAHELTDDNTSDPAIAGSSVLNAGGRVRRVSADGAYDGAPIYEAIHSARPAKAPPKIVIPPGVSSIRPLGRPSRRQ